MPTGSAWLGGKAPILSQLFGGESPAGAASRCRKAQAARKGAPPSFAECRGRLARAVGLGRHACASPVDESLAGAPWGGVGSPGATGGSRSSGASRAAAVAGRCRAAAPTPRPPERSQFLPLCGRNCDRKGPTPPAPPQRSYFFPLCGKKYDRKEAGGRSPRPRSRRRGRAGWGAGVTAGPEPGRRADAARRRPGAGPRALAFGSPSRRAGRPVAASSSPKRARRPTRRRIDGVRPALRRSAPRLPL